ncbi:MAG: hypothetical protein R3C11_24670 [Planctomycetaceae bacterium]
MLIRKTTPHDLNSIEEGFSEVVGFEIGQIRLTYALPESPPTPETIVSLSEGRFLLNPWWSYLILKLQSQF